MARRYYPVLMVLTTRTEKAEGPFAFFLALLIGVPLLIGFCAIYPLYLIYKLFEPAQEEQDTKRTKALVEKAQELQSQLPQQDNKQVFDDVIERVVLSQDGDTIPAGPVLRAIGETIADLYSRNDVAEHVDMPRLTDGIEGGRERDRLRKRIGQLTPDNIELVKDTIAASISAFIAYLPKAVFHTPEDMRRLDKQTTEKRALNFDLLLVDVLPSPGEQITAMSLPFFDDRLVDANLFIVERWQHWRNLYFMSGKDAPLEPEKSAPRLTHPTEHKGTPREIISGYLRGTALLKLFDVIVPFTIPPLSRFEHQWIISPPGTGKSTTLSAMILQDLDLVARDEASVIVMESNRDLIKAIEGLKRFGPGGDLEGRLVVIDVEDVEWPIAINLFDVGLREINQASPRDKEALLNSAVSMLDYVFRALLGAELTSRQSTLFNFTIQLLIHIPEATLDTLIDLMQPKGLEKYQQYVDRLDRDARLFFELKFSSKEFEQTKSQVTDRIFAIKRIRSLARMFASPKTKLDLFKEMGEGKVILINAAKSLLQEEGVEVFGRFFLASILLAAEKRQLLAKDDRMPTFVYIDEAHDIIRRDEKISILLDQARKFRVAMILAHQRCDQLTAPVLNALYGSTAIKFAAQVSDANASALARNMGTTPEFIMSQPPYSYAVSVRGQTKTAISLQIPHVDLNSLERMTEGESRSVRALMREKYAVARGEVERPELPAPASGVETSSEGVKASPDW
jgi:hypothetical protein